MEAKEWYQLYQKAFPLIALAVIYIGSLLGGVFQSAIHHHREDHQFSLRRSSRKH